MRAQQLEQLRLRNMEEGGFGPRVMMQIKVCQHCKTPAPASQFYCRECGHELPKQSLYERYKQIHRCCSVCDTVVADGVLYCPQCGERIPLRKQMDFQKKF